MTKYIVINWSKDKKLDNNFPRIEEQPSFVIDDGVEKKVFICDVCFKTFSTNDLHHLESCNLVWPYDDCGYKLCKYDLEHQLRVYRIDQESNVIHTQIVRAIVHLGNLSKDEQNLGLPISTRGLVGTTYYDNYNISKHYFYVLFEYKKIITYALVQIYVNNTTFDKKIIIRDFYTFPIYRGKNYSYELISKVAEDNCKKVEDLIFSRPISEKLKRFLKKYKIYNIKTIQEENFLTLREEEL